MQPKPLSLCQHCGISVAEGTAFCCAGCESVFTLFQERGLTHYYALKEKFPIRAANPVAIENQTEVPEEITHLNRARFYLEGIHCLGCLWLLEKLPEIESGILSSKLDIAHQILEIEVQKGKEWKGVLALLARLGYRAKPLALDDPNAVQWREKDQRRQLARLAIAGFSSGNIMLLAVSLYAGASGYWAKNFQWLSVVLAIPVLTYCAWPLYKSAFGPLREKRISVDLPIALAILAGVALSLWSLIAKDGSELYFDSLSMLVFLLLSSRYLLARLRESLAKEGVSLSFLSNIRFHRIAPTSSMVRADELRVKDLFRLEAGQTLPVDSILKSEQAYFDLSLLTGESLPVKYQLHDYIEAGAKLTSGIVNFEAERETSESRLGKILDQIRAFQHNRSPSLEFADRMGRYFVYVVLFAAGLTLFAFTSGDLSEGMRRALALVIVTCPCVLAFAVPLALTRSLQVAARRGVLVRSADKVEALAEITTAFFDKTGTLTTGEYKLIDWTSLSPSQKEAQGAAFALESFSSHPIAKAITRSFSHLSPPEKVSDFREIPGFGVSGKINGITWRVHRMEATTEGHNRIGIYRGSQLEAIATLGDSLREEATRAIKEIQSLGIHPILLSGDAEANVRAVANKVGIKKWQHRLLPEEKAKIVKEVPNSVMIGDGANDAIAFQAASVGVAMQGSVELSLKNADIALTKPGLESFLEAVRISRSTMKLVRMNFSFTLIYNLIAGALAIAGFMEPLLAAIIMPASALTVFLFTQWATSWREL